MSKKENIFRGRSLDRGQWIYGANLSLDDKEYILPAAKGDIVNFSSICFFVRAIEVEPETVGQYINFNDQEYNDIYEDDLLELIDIETGEITDIYKVTYSPKTLCWLLEPQNDPFAGQAYFDDLEQEQLLIVGNIHEPKQKATEEKP